MTKLHAVTQEKVENMDMCFYNCHRWSLSRNVTKIIKIIFYPYMGLGLSLIRYGTTHDNYLQDMDEG